MIYRLSLWPILSQKHRETNPYVYQNAKKAVLANFAFMRYNPIGLSCNAEAGAMRLTAKGRYAVAAMIYMTGHMHETEPTTVLRVSSELGISKIYLEQVFALLKRSGFVKSVKGSQGGYYLSCSPGSTTAYDILSAVEGSLFEGSEERFLDAAPHIDRVIREDILNETDEAIRSVLSRITLTALADRAASDPAHIYYI